MVFGRAVGGHPSRVSDSSLHRCSRTLSAIVGALLLTLALVTCSCGPGSNNNNGDSNNNTTPAPHGFEPLETPGVTTITGTVVLSTDTSQVVSDAYVYTVPGVGARARAALRQTSSTTTQTGDDGSYELVDLAAGLYTVVIEPPPGSGLAALTVELQVSGGASVSLRLTLTPQDVVDQIASVTVTPQDARVAPGETLQYAANIRDADGNALDLAPTWLTTGNVGSIGESGGFTAGARQANGWVQAVVGASYGQTSVHVVEPGNELPQVTVAVDPSTGLAPLGVTAVASATDNGSVRSVLLDWGDGNQYQGTAFPATLAHTYPGSGTYRVLSRAADDQGAEGLAVAWVRVTASSEAGPTCSISALPRAGEAPLVVTFGATASDPDGSIVSCSLDFGDTTTPWTGSEAPEGVAHTYERVGNFLVTLSVTDDSGLSGRATTSVAVSSPTNEPPTAVLEASPLSGPAPLLVSFLDGGSTDGDGAIVLYRLDVHGDGVYDWSDVSPPDRVSFSYAREGSYQARLLVVDDDGATAETAVDISVTAGPRLTVSPTFIDLGGSGTSDTFAIGNAGGGALSWSCSSSSAWLSVSPSNGTGDATITVMADRSGLASGVHVGTIVVESGLSSVTVNVRLLVHSPAEIAVAPSSLVFNVGTNTQVLSITNLGTAPLSWTCDETADWMSVAPTFGAGNGTVTVTVDRSSVDEGVVTSVLAVRGGATTVEVPVELRSWGSGDVSVY